MMRMLSDAYIVWDKEMRVWAKTPMVSLGRAFIMPLIWLVIFGNVFGGTANNVPIALVMEDNGHYANEFVQLLTNKNILRISANTNHEHALELLEQKKVSAVVFMPPDFSDKIIRGETGEVQVSIDSTTPLLASTVNSVMLQSQEVFKNKLMLEFRNPETPEIVRSIEVQENILFGRGMRYIDFMAAGVIVQVMVFTALFAGGLGLILDREIGTLKLLMAAPIDRMSIVLGKITAGVSQALVSGAIALAIAVFMGVQIKTGLIGIILVFVVLALIAFGFIGMTVALATRIHSLETFGMVIPTVIMPIWFLSGALYPIETIPSWLRPFSIINPLTYATEAVRSLMLRGVVWEALAFDFVVLIAFSAFMVFVGSKAFKRTLA